MSDAKGPNDEPTTGEPIEENGRLDGAAPETADAARDAETPAEADQPGTTPSGTGEVPVSRREARAATGPTDVVAAPADAAPAEEPARDAQPAEAADAQPAAEEPDYAALAADLDALESRGATTTVTTRSGGDAEKKPDPWFEPADKTQTFTASDAYDAPTAAEPAITASEPVAPEQSAAAPASQPAQMPIFVQAPEPPRLRGNRGAAGAIGILAALVFAVLYFGATLGFRALNGEVTLDNIADGSLDIVTSLGFWTTVVVFFLGFWLLGAIVNRARWAAWVLLGIFVAAIAYLGHIAGALVDAPFWNLTGSEAATEVQDQLLSPLAIAAFVFAREITIWFGAWVARRGARVTERNEAAQAEYERTLEAGPKLS